MTDIRTLDEQTVERIAAGEVVERPASVVKELVENSVDADASRVDVTVEAGGAEGIRVRDDGVGMTEEEVRLAVREHTTSKIRDIHDLESGVATLGFRGEALHAIGAVSRLTVTTRKRGASRGTKLRVEGGEVTHVGPAGCPEGTTVAVEDLFYNVPARRKYLKQDSTEFSHVNNVVTGYALANPDVAVSLSHEDRETFATSGRDDLRSAVMAVYGRDVAANMIPVEAGSGRARDGVREETRDEEETEDADGDSGDIAADGPLEGVSGLVSHPETNRAGREYMNAFVNGRYVTVAAVREAVVDAYGTQLAPDRYPFAVLFLDLPAGAVDVNVHPRKLEVRFADEQGMQRQVRTAVADALLSEGLLRSSAPRGRSKADQTEITPGNETGRPGEADARNGSDPRNGPGARPGEGPESTDDGDQPPTAGSADPSTDDPVAAGEAMTEEATADEATTDEAKDDVETTDETPTGDLPGNGPTAADVQSPVRGGDNPHSTRNEGVGGSGEGPAGRDAVGRSSRNGGRKFRAEPDQRALDGNEPAAREFSTLPAMRVLGQLHDTYVVAETDDGLVLVDQHAADERVHYEQLCERFAGDVATQALAEPVELAVTAQEAELLQDHGDALSKLGFRATLVDDQTARVTTVPALLADDGPELARDLLSEFVSGDPAATVEAAADELLGDLACYPAVTGNESLTEGSVTDLLASLDDCENPYACPHGRPVIVELGHEEIEERFERDYPGHAGRRPEQ